MVVYFISIEKKNEDTEFVLPYSYLALLDFTKYSLLPSGVQLETKSIKLSVSNSSYSRSLCSDPQMPKCHGRK